MFCDNFPSAYSENMASDDQEKFCLKWNEFETNISLAFRELHEENDFLDVTLGKHNFVLKIERG